METIEYGYIKQYYRIYDSDEECQRTYTSAGGWSLWSKPLLQLDNLVLDYNFGVEWQQFF